MTTSRLNFAAIIKERVSSREMLESVGVAVDRRGMAKCPFHGDGDASLKVYRDTRRGWHCYGCHAGGDVMDFAKLWWGVSFTEAMDRINEAFALGLPLHEKPKGDEMKKLREDIRRRQKEQNAHEKAITEAEEAYFKAFEAWLTNEQVIRFERPRGPQEPMSEEFIYAITHQAEIRDNLEMAEERRWSARAAG